MTADAQSVRLAMFVMRAAAGAKGQHRFGFEVVGVPLAALIVVAIVAGRPTSKLHAHEREQALLVRSFRRAHCGRRLKPRRHEMANTIDEQQNTMDEPGGPEAPLPDKYTPRTKTGNKRADKAAHGEPTDPDFEPPVVPGDTHGASRG
jgi:hypothetical protein